MFDPSTWDRKEVIWKDKPFVREHVRAFMHVPLNMNARMTHAMALIEAAHAKAPQGLMLADESSPWRSELYIDVAGPVPGAEMGTLSGHFLTKVYDGPFREEPRWAEDMRHHVEDRGHRLGKLYFAYTTCPRCAKAYGHNYVVAFADVDRGQETVRDAAAAVGWRGAVSAEPRA